MSVRGALDLRSLCPASHPPLQSVPLPPPPPPPAPPFLRTHLKLLLMVSLGRGMGLLFRSELTGNLLYVLPLDLDLFLDVSCRGPQDCPAAVAADLVVWDTAPGAAAAVLDVARVAVRVADEAPLPTAVQKELDLVVGRGGVGWGVVGWGGVAAKVGPRAGDVRRVARMSRARGGSLAFKRRFCVAFPRPTPPCHASGAGASRRPDLRRPRCQGPRTCRRS